MSGVLAYFDCFSGASGDMILGALLDAGLPLETLSEDIALLSCGPIRLRAEKVPRGGISATKVTVDISGEPGHIHRGLHEIREIIGQSRLPEQVKERSIRVFTRLAEAEAFVHNVPVESIHFHEVGALDAIADIVGAVSGLERLGVTSVFFSTLRLGGGTIEAGHGALPVPAPATARLVTGFRCELGPVKQELLTPTAAALLTTLGTQQTLPPIRIEKVGYGAGTRDDPRHPNVLRLILAQAAPEPVLSEAEGTESDTVWVLEANLDDMTPEVCGYAIERLLDAGALDAYALPIQMKKSRPAWMLCAIVEESALARAEEIFFRETTTFGVRRYRAERAKLAREIRTVQTPYGPIRVKVGKRGGLVTIVSPEYEDCRRIALEKNVPLREVMQVAQRLFSAQSA